MIYFLCRLTVEGQVNFSCKRCGASEYTRNGFVRGKQRYYCKKCGYNFTNTQARGRPKAVKALAILLYRIGKASYRFLGKLLNASPAAVYKWVSQAALNLPEPEGRGDVREMELDEMWHFLRSKKTSAGYGRPLTVVEGAVSPGLWAAVILRRFSDSGRESGEKDAFTTPMTGAATRR